MRYLAERYLVHFVVVTCTAQQHILAEKIVCDPACSEQREGRVSILMVISEVEG